MTEYNIWCFGLLGVKETPMVITFNICYNIRKYVYVVYVAQESSCAY